MLERIFRPILVVIGLAFLPFTGGCSTIRVTDPYSTADEQFLQSDATRMAVARITAAPLRDRKVYVDGSYLSTLRENSVGLSYTETSPVNLFLLAELRAKLLMSGARLVKKADDAEIVVEVRTGGIGVDHEEFLLGIPNITVATSTVAAVPIQTPEIALLKSTKQFGFASAAFVAYWRDTGEVVASSGPYVGRTARKDYWILGFGPRTVGDIPPAKPAGP
jgi:hypothetical protein